MVDRQPDPVDKRESELWSLLHAYDEQLDRNNKPGGTDDSSKQDRSQIPPESLVDEFDDLRECADLLERLRLQSNVNPLGETQSGNNAELPSHIGRFQIVDEIGRGGGGVVLLAHDPDLGREVALKLPHPQALVMPDLRRRFVEEAKAVASLQHPNILAVHEVGEYESVCYIASPYIQGANLAQWMETNEKAPSIDVAVHLLLQIAEAVQYAHSRGILHRDIKPSNILLLTEDADHGQSGLLAKLADFGLAKRLDDDESKSLTQSGVVLGTPQYMAPEQVEGNKNAIGTHTDIWALGVLMYELLHGVSPFAADSKAATFQKILAREPFDLLQDKKQIPADLRAICRKCLQRNPADRYDSVAAVVADIKRFNAGMPTEARPLSNWEQASRLVLRHPAASLSLFVCFCAVSLVMAISWKSAQRVRVALAETQHLLYVDDVRLAAQAIESGNARQADRLLARHLPNTEEEQDRRDFAWRYLWGQIHREAAILEMPDKASAVGAGFSSDGNILLTASEGEDTRLQVWNTKTWECENTLAADARILRIEFGSLGKRFLTFTEAGVIEVRSMDSQEVIHSVPLRIDAHCGAFDEERNKLLLGDDEGQLYVVDLDNDTGNPVEVGRHIDVEDIAVSLDGTWVASCGDNSTLELWAREAGGSTKHSLPLMGAAISQDLRFDVVKFSPDGNLLAVGAQTGEVFIWDIRSKIEVARSTEHTSNIYDLEFAPDSRQLATASKDTTVRLIDIGTNRRSTVIQGHGRPVYHVSFSPDGAWLATCGKGGTTRVWDQLHSSFTEETLPWHRRFRYPVPASAFGKISMGWTGGVYVDSIGGDRMVGRHKVLARLSVATGREIAVSAGMNLAPADGTAGHAPGRRSVVRADVDADGDLDEVTSFGFDRDLLWRENQNGVLATPTLLAKLGVDDIAATRLVSGFEPNGGIKVARCSTGAGNIWLSSYAAAATPSLKFEGFIHPTSAWSCDMDSDGDQDLVVAEYHSDQLRWLENKGDNTFGKKHAIAEVANVYSGLAADFDQDMREELYLMSAEGSRILKTERALNNQWASPQTFASDLPFPSMLQILDVNSDGWLDLVCASRKKIVWFHNTSGKLSPVPLTLEDFSGSWTQPPAANIAIWDLSNAKLVTAYAEHGEVGNVALSSDAEYLATVVHGEQDVVRIRRTSNGQQVAILPPIDDSGQVSGIAFSDCGRYLMFGAGDCGYVWDLEQNRMVHKLVGHDNTVERLTLSPNGRQIVSCSHDHTIRFWDRATGRVENVLVGHKQRPVAMCWGPDQKILASGGRYGEVVLWDVVTGQELLRFDDLQCKDLQTLQFLDDNSLSALVQVDVNGRNKSRVVTWKTQ